MSGETNDRGCGGERQRTILLESRKAEIEGCGDYVRVIERYIPDDEVGVLLTHCDAVLLPYTDFNSDSGVAALALANGRPIIARRTGGLAALLDASESESGSRPRRLNR